MEEPLDTSEMTAPPDLGEYVPPPEPPAAAAAYGAEFFVTASKRHRMKFGPVEEVPTGNGEQTEPRVVSPVLTSDMDDDAERLGATLTAALQAIAWGEPRTVGETPAPASFAWPHPFALPSPAFEQPVEGLEISNEELAEIEAANRFTESALARAGGLGALLSAPIAAPVSEPSTPEKLTEFDGTPFDRRKLHVLIALDRSFENYVDRRARRIWQALVGTPDVPGVSLPEAVEAANRFSAGSAQPQLSHREGFELAQREAYRLGLYIVLVQNRDKVPPSARLG